MANRGIPAVSTTGGRVPEHVADAAADCAQRMARLGGWMFDHPSGRLTWSHEVFQLFEMASEGFDGTYEAFLEAIHPDDRQAVNQAFFDSLASRQPYEITHRLCLRDGRVRWLHEKCETEFDGCGQPLRSRGMVQDISERHEAMLSLQASEARYRSLFENANTGIASTDADGRLSSFNEAFRALLGYDAETLSRMNFSDFTHPGDLERERVLFDEAQRGRRDHYRIEKRYLTAAGHPLWVDISVSVIRNEQGAVASFVAVVVDISGRRRAEAALRDSHETLRGILETTLDGYWRTDIRGRLLDVNPAYCRHSGYTREELMCLHISDLEASESAAETEAHLRYLMEHGGDLFESRHRRKDGSVWDVEISATYRPDEDGGQLFVFVRDISGRKAADTELRIAAATFEAQEGMMVTDAGGTILRVNQAFTEITGYPAGEVVGRKPSMLQSGWHDAAFFREMWDTIQRTGGWQGEIWDRRKNGEIYPKWLTISAVRDAAGRVTHYVGTHADITERKLAEERVRQLAFYDPLTRLPNRRLFADRLAQAMALSRRRACHGALMFIDLDNFKPLNDRYGHALGDLLLVEVAERLQRGVREMDTVARLGGDEFVVLLCELDAGFVASKRYAAQVAANLLAALSAPCLLRAEPAGGAATVVEHQCSASIGVTLFADHRSRAEDIVARADRTMYRAKEAGRNAIRFDDET